MGQLESAHTFSAGRRGISSGVAYKGKYRIWRCMDPPLHGMLFDRNADDELMHVCFDSVRVICIVFDAGQKEEQKNGNSLCPLFAGRIWHHFIDLKERDLRKWKASYTVEASFIVPLVIGTMTLAMKMGISCYQEVREGKEQQQSAKLWEVEDFYHYQALKEVTHD